jgi:GNAT superfamily N-acetyltransferase
MCEKKLSGVNLSSVSYCDIGPIVSMLTRCSPTSLLARFHAPVRSAPIDFVARTVAGRPGEFAFAIRVDSEIVGLAQLHVDECGDGEAALLIEDAFQGQGRGTAAGGFLVWFARQLGLGHLTATVRNENVRVLEGLYRRASVRLTYGSGIVSIRLDLAVDDRRDSPDPVSRVERRSHSSGFDR